MSSICGQMTLAVLLIVGVMTSSALTCTYQHVIQASVRHVDATSGSVVMNMSLYFRESAIIQSRKSQTLLRHFPDTPTLKTDLTSLKLTTQDGHSLPWTRETRTGSEQILGVKFTLDGHPTTNDVVVVDFEYVAHVRSDAITQEACSRFFQQLVYPVVVVGEECTAEFQFVIEPTAWGQECNVRFTGPAVHVNTTPAFTAASRRPEVFEIALKCFGGETCTCACSDNEITSFCRQHLTETKMKALFPDLWNDHIFTIVVVPFFFSVLVMIVYKAFFEKRTVGKYLMMVFNGCVIFSVSSLLVGSLVIPVHFDAAIRACSTVFESQGGYFFPLLFWAYFPYVITLLITTGFIDNGDLVVSLNGNVKKAFVVYQYLSPLVQIWLFLYVYVIPVNDALLLTAAVSALSCLRLYFRSPFRSEQST